MFGKKINLSWSPENQTVLLDLANERIYYYEKDWEEIHNLFGGEPITGKTGEDYCFIPETVIEISSYIGNCNPIVNSTKEMEFGEDKTLSIYCPLNRGNIILLIQEWDYDGIWYPRKQCIYSLFSISCLFDFIKKYFDESFDDMISDIDSNVKPIEIENISYGTYEIYIDKGLDYSYARAFIDDKFLESKENGRIENSRIVKFFNIQKNYEGDYFLLDSFNKKIYRKYLGTDCPLYRDSKYIENELKCRLVYDTQKIRVALKHVGNDILLIGYLKMDRFIKEWIKSHPAFKEHKGKEMYVEYDLQVSKLDYNIKKEMYIQKIVETVKFKARSEIKWNIRIYRKSVEETKEEKHHV